MLTFMQGTLLSYFALLILASCTQHIRDDFWSPYLNILRKPNMPVWLSTLSNGYIGVLRSLSYCLIGIALYQFSTLYGTSIGISNWFCTATVLSAAVVVTLSYARRSFKPQLVTCMTVAVVMHII